MKSKILNYIYKNNSEFFYNKVLKNVPPEKIDLEKVYEENKKYFETLFVKDFIGYIPKEVNEPALKAFENNGDAIEKWILWQSWYINRKALNEPVKILFYSGMMVYLKVLYTLANANKKIPTVYVPREEKVEQSFLDKALSGVDDFRNNFNKKDGNTNQGDKNANNEESKSTKANKGKIRKDKIN